MVSTLAATSVAGFQGKIGDATYPLIMQAAGPVQSVEGMAPTAAGATRVVNLTAGNATSRGVRGVFAAAAIDIPVPNAGGQWYLVAIRRRASDKLCQIEVLPGPTATDAAQGYIPSSVPATWLQNVGVEEHQGLAWAYSRVGSSTVQVFDVRLARTGASNGAAMTLHGLAFAFWANLMLDGALLSVLRHNTRSGGVHVASRWTRDGSALLPVGTIETDNTGAVGRSVRDDITDVLGLPPLGTRCTERVTKTTFQWANPPGDDPTAVTPLWRPWDSEWQYANDFGYQGTSQAPYERKGRMRYVGGQVLFVGQLTLSGGNLNGALVIGLPVPIDSSRFGYDLALRGTVRLLNASDSYRGYVAAYHANDANSVRIDSLFIPGNTGNPGANSDVTGSVPFNEQWGQSDQARFSFLYDPA